MIVQSLFYIYIHSDRTNEMEFFKTVDDTNKLVLPTGEVLEDTAIIPGFVQNNLGMNIADAWDSLRMFPNHPVDQDIEIKSSEPQWITGDHPALNYRGNAIKRDKIWLQNDFENGMRRYGYTGWQWKVSGGVKAISEVPLVETMFNKVSTVIGQEMNAMIATRYRSGKDNIGFHSDKIRDFENGTCFVVIKMGESRPFEFSWDEPDVVSAKEVIKKSKDIEEIKRARETIKNRVHKEVFYSKELSAGTAVIVGFEANKRVKHGVPPIAKNDHLSGSLVGRTIKTIIPWSDVVKKIKSCGSKRKREE